MISLRVLGTLALATVLTVNAPAQQAVSPNPAPIAGVTPPRPNGNGALLYLRAEQLNVRTVFRNTLATYSADPAWKPGDEAKAELTRRKDMVDLLTRAASTRTCQWQIDSDRGWLALCPHYACLRSYARILDAASRDAAANGRAEESAVRLAAILRMSTNMRNDSQLQSIPLAVNLAGLACDRIEASLKSGSLAGNALKPVAQALADFPTEDPFGAADAILHEGWTATQWLPDQEEPFKEGPAAIVDYASALAPVRAKAELSKLKPLPKDPAMLRVEMLIGALFFEEAARSWPTPDGAARLRRLSRRTDEGEFGAFLSWSRPDLPKLYEQVKAVTTRIATLRQKCQ